MSGHGRTTGSIERVGCGRGAPVDIGAEVSGPPVGGQRRPECAEDLPGGRSLEDTRRGAVRIGAGDVDAADVLIAAGADLEAAGGSIGTPLDNAVGYGCWHVARRLVERGAVIGKLWHAAALGELSALAGLLDTEPGPTPDAINEAFWQAAHGGQLRAADLLLQRGADIDAVPDYAHGATVVEIATRPDTRRAQLATWLIERGGRQPAVGEA